MHVFYRNMTAEMFDFYISHYRFYVQAMSVSKKNPPEVFLTLISKTVENF